jgi:hypothetical protein
MLPRTSRLYDAANESGRLALKFFDLTEGLESQLAAVAAFQPSVLVAPPHALIALARADLPLAPRQIFSGAEVLDPVDRREIEARFAVTVREIYMATEGLLGVACSHGTLHLCEDCVAFGWEPEGECASLPGCAPAARRCKPFQKSQAAAMIPSGLRALTENPFWSHRMSSAMQSSARAAVSRISVPPSWRRRACH